MVHFVKLLSRSEEQTMKIGRAVGRHLSEGDIVGLTGVLGSGKSVMARGILRSLGIHGEIPSPSFIIAASYEGDVPVNHIDLYRLESADDAVGLGLEDLLYSRDISVIEWAEKIAAILPEVRIDVRIDPGKERDDRLITIRPLGDSVKSRLVALFKELMRAT